MTAAPDVVVVGGGIVGCAAAAFLARAGLTVTLVEREGLASAASGANSGVVQHPLDHALAPLYEETVALYEELSALDLGFQLGAEPSGLLFVTRDPRAAERLVISIRTEFPAQDARLIAGAELRNLEPALHPALVACRVRLAQPVPPAASTYAYATLAERHGAAIRLGHEARLEVAGDRVVGVRIDGSVTPAGAVLVAAGPWTPAVVDPSGAWRPIHRRWGVVVETALPAPPRHVLEEAEIDAVLAGGASESVPATRRPVARQFSLVTAGGVSAVGSSFLPDEPDPSAWVAPLLTRGGTFVPQVLDSPIRGARACARPVSLDGRPLIGSLPGLRGLYVCAGHGPWGISTGPASARLAVDLVMGRTPHAPKPMDAARFGSPFADAAR